MDSTRTDGTARAANYLAGKRKAGVAFIARHPVNPTGI